MVDEDPITIDCCHGRGQTAAVICCHQLCLEGPAVGWVEFGSDADNLQAWCERCEAAFLREGEKTQSFLEFNDFKMVCVQCYALRKEKHDP